MARFLPAEPPRKRQFVAATPEAGWSVFSNQAAAFAHIDSLGPSTVEASMVWSLELDSSGRRSYAVASLSDFWRRYKQLPASHRHYYELIRSGMPCHLYLDLEFCRRTNPNSDGERMIGTLMDDYLGQ